MERQFGARLTWLALRSAPRVPARGDPARRARGALRRRATTPARARCSPTEGLVYAPPARRRLRTRAWRSSWVSRRAPRDVHRAYHDRVMDAYWAEGVDLSQRPALEQLARDAGVSDDGIAQALDDRAWAPGGGRLDPPRAGRRRDRRAVVRDRLAAARRSARSRASCSPRRSLRRVRWPPTSRSRSRRGLT